MSGIAGAGVTILGSIDAVDVEGIARGWCWSPQQPDRRRSVVILVDDVPLATTLCDQPNPELRDLGMGDGAHGFTIRLPRSRLSRRAAVELRLRDADTGANVGGAFPLAPDVLGPAATTLRYSLDRVQEEGLVSGWCWDSSEPERRVRLLVLADGEAVGAVAADQFRGDLRDAGIGDGAHGFTFLLPWETIADRSVVHVRLAEEGSGEVLGASVLFRRPALVPIEERIRTLEHEVRLMGARVEDARRQARHDAAILRGVLATMGAFFTRLSELPPEEVPTALVPSLGGLLGGMAERFAPISLAVPIDPVLTLCVAADGPVGSIHACLQTIHAAGLDSRAEVFLLDDGTLDEAALLPSLVQNLRPWRVQPGQSVVSTRNHVALPSALPFVAFLSSAVRVASDWLPEILESFEREANCAVLGTKLLRDDNTVEAWGLLPDRHGRLHDPARAEHALDPRYDALARVAAVTDVACVVRGEAFARLGGFDTGFTEARAATTDLCLRAWAAGMRVLVQPVPALRWDGTATASDAGEAALDLDLADLLADRCGAEIVPAWTDPTGRVLLLDMEADGPMPDPAVMALAWRHLGWEAEFAFVDSMSAEGEAARALRARGVLVLRAPFQPSVAAALREAPGRYGAVQVAGAAARLLPPGRLRALAPGAQVLLALDRRDADRPAEQLADWAVEAHGVLVRNALKVEAALQGVLPQAVSLDGQFDPAPGGVRADSVSLQNLWLFGATRGRLVAQVLTRLAREAPGIGLHAPRGGLAGGTGDVVLHDAPAEVPPDGTRLALAFGPPGALPDPRLVRSCLCAGVPVLLAGGAGTEGVEASPVGTLVLSGGVNSIVAGVLSAWDDKELHQRLASPAQRPEEAKVPTHEVLAVRLRSLLEGIHS